MSMKPYFVCTLIAFLTGCGGWQPLKPQEDSATTASNDVEVYAVPEAYDPHPTDLQQINGVSGQGSSATPAAKTQAFTLYLYPNKEGEKGHFIELQL
jgi:hypothetical protein